MLRGKGKKKIEEIKADFQKIEMMLRMFYNAIYRSLRVDYVLVDSWFTCEALINAVISQDVHLIGMYKIATTKFSYNGKVNSMIYK